MRLMPILTAALVCAFVYATLGVFSSTSSVFMTGRFTEALGGVPLTAILPLVLLPDAIVNALIAAETKVGVNDTRVESIDHERLRKVLRDYGRLIEKP